MHDFWLHVNQYSIRGEGVIHGFVSLEVRSYESLAEQLTTVSYFLKQSLEESLTDLISTLANLDRNHGHVLI